MPVRVIIKYFSSLLKVLNGFISVCSGFILKEMNENEVELKNDMMKRLKRIFVTGCIMLGTTAFSQDLDTYDADMDGRLDHNEFMERTSADYDEWDANRDGMLDDREFTDRTYQDLDLNQDDLIDENEWNTGVNTTAGQYLKAGDYAVFDSDRDGILNNDEWNEGMTDNSWFDTYDLDRNGSIDNDEWNEGVFNDYDINDDNFIDADEYSDYYGDDNW